MLSKIEIRLIDDEGNMSKAFIDYRGYTKMLVEHRIDMINDALVGMVADYNYKKELEIKKEESAIEREVKEALLKEEGRRDQ